MQATRIFIEHRPGGMVDRVRPPSRRNGRGILDKQEIAPRPPLRQAHPSPLRAPKSHINSTPFSQNVKAKRKSVLVFLAFSLCVCAMYLSSIYIRSYVWERMRTPATDPNALYDRLLVEEPFPTDSGSGAVSEYVIPTLSLHHYTVKKGDSLFGVSRTFNVTVDTIISANDITNAFSLSIGKDLVIPDRSGVYHSVAKGESLSSIASRYGVALNDLADVNDLSSSVLQVGQKLFVPGGRMSDWDRAAVLGELFIRPTRGIITSPMGFRRDPFTGLRMYHSGVDIANRIGTSVVSSQQGRVVFAGYRGNYGKTVIVSHPRGYTTLYGHLSRILVKRGQTVRQGQRIGDMGSTGRSTGPHLHFEVHQRNKLIDPLTIVRF
jgi:murein DD-endopeptidase MepM/ murein hydrolase activator NlpD